MKTLLLLVVAILATTPSCSYQYVPPTQTAVDTYEAKIKSGHQALAPHGHLYQTNQSTDLVSYSSPDHRTENIGALVTIRR